jgi:hypothetical protein
MGLEHERPRCIYTYWHQLPMPDCVQRCLNTMRTCNPAWQLIVLTPASFPIPAHVSRLQPAHQSDWVRLETLSQRGGVWLDASCICTAPLERWAGAADSGNLVGFEYHPRCMENFAFACPPRHPLVLAWRHQFNRAIAMGFAAYCAQPRVRELLGLRLRKDMPYLTAYACFLAARNGNASANGSEPERLRLLPATAPDGPLWYLSTSFLFPWNPERIVAQLANRPSSAQLTKLVRHHRPILQRRIDHRDYTADSFLCTSLHLPLPLARPPHTTATVAAAVAAAALAAAVVCACVLLVLKLRALRKRVVCSP